MGLVVFNGYILDNFSLVSRLVTVTYNMKGRRKALGMHRLYSDVCFAAFCLWALCLRVDSSSSSNSTAAPC